MSTDDEQLFGRYTQTGDQQAFEELVAKYTPLAKKLARRYSNTVEPMEDLVQVSSVGLLKAIKGYDPSRKIPFVNYATPTILGEIKRHFRDTTWAVSMPRDLQELTLKIDHTVSSLTDTMGRMPTVREIGVKLEISEGRVLEALQAANNYVAVSLDKPHASPDGDNFSLIDYVGSDDIQYELTDSSLVVAPALKLLPKRERTILYLRFSKEMTQSEIAELVGISQMHVSRSLKRALDILRQNT